MNDLMIFADYGLDDAAATVSILNRAERFDWIYIIPIGGNVPVEVAYRNCFTLLSRFDGLAGKVSVVDTRHIPQPSEYLADIHGQDGMGDLFSPAMPEEPVAVIPFEVFLDSLRGEETVLSLGPMTLVRPVMERHAHPLVIMGGCIDTPPNFNGYEFNHALDKEAFSYCVGFPHALITLDTCRVGGLDISKTELPGEDLHSQILRAAKGLATAWDDSGCHVWDDVAAGYLLFPQRFRLEERQDPYGNRVSNAVYCSDKVYYED